MTGEWIRFGLTALCVLAGCFALLTAMVGLFRFDFTLNRLHAASIADTLLLVVILQWCTSPLSGHMLAQFEYRVNQNLEQHLELPDGEQEAGQ